MCSMSNEESESATFVIFFCLFISYSSASRDNCQLCDRPVNQLDYYADIEPDRDYDIYAMTDDPVMCSKPIPPERPNNARRFQSLSICVHVIHALIRRMLFPGHRRQPIFQIDCSRFVDRSFSW